MLTLARRSFQRSAIFLTTLVTVLAAVQIAIVALAASFESTRSFERLIALVPAFLTRSIAGSLVSLASFRTMAISGYLHPVVVMLIVELAIYLATEPAGDVELGLVDLVLARPVPRAALVTRSVVVTAGATAATVCVMALAAMAGIAALAPPQAQRPAVGTIGRLSIALLLVSWCFGAAALAASTFVRRRAPAILGVGVAAISLYLLEFVGSAWTAAEPYAIVSPFHYYEGTAILTGHAALARDTAALGTTTIVFVAIAYWKFSHRDL